MIWTVQPAIIATGLPYLFVTVFTPARWLRLSAFLLAAGSSVFASTLTRLNDDAFAALRDRAVSRRVRLDRIPLYDAKRSAIDLEEFQVWAPGAKVILHGDNGVILERLDPPARRFFRGLVNGDPESFAFFSTDPSGRDIEGLIVTRDKRFAVRSSRRRDESIDQFLTEFDATDAVTGEPRTWQCDVDRANADPPGPIHVIGPDGRPVIGHGISGSQAYAITVEIETDYELYANAGGNAAAATAITNSLTTLTGAVSTIYNRDLMTNVTLANLNIYTTASDPWSQPDAVNGLNELGEAYHNPSIKPAGRTSSAVVMLSGKAANGFAWLHRICAGDVFNGTHWVGPYAFCGSVGVSAATPDPNATVGGYLYGMDASQNYWALEEYAHELGHNMGGMHTHCVAITAGEVTQAGFTDGSTAAFVDHCYGSEGAGCFSGANYAAGSPGVYHGTIMSYCQNVFAGGFPQSRYVFGLASEPSHHELDDYMLRATGPMNSGTNIVNGVGSFTMSAITAPASVAASATGITASVTAAGATSIVWTITNGTITSSATGSSIIFTAGATGSTILRVTAYEGNLCGITDTKSVAIISVNPPTGVTAVATGSTTVSVSWTLASGATSYHIYRSADHLNFVQVPGNPTTPPFADTTAAPNTAYLYAVRSFDGANESANSNVDLATAVIFTDATLTAGVTAIKAVHFTELRTAVSAVHVLAGLGAVTFTDSNLDSTVTIQAVHLNELRSNLDAARTALGLSAVSYSDGPSVTAQSTAITASHINELRGGVQ
jgi:metallopeptidase family M12-like protein